MQTTTKNIDDFPFQTSISLRWSDNDIYGHVNNVKYYSFFDTAVNCYLIEKAGLNIHHDDIVGFVVASNCEYLKSIAYPNTVKVGVAVAKLGHSSVEYKLGVFDQNQTLCATGAFTHVFVSQNNNKSVEMPTAIRSALEKISINEEK